MTAVKNDFAKLLSILNMVKRRITEFGNKGIETFQLEMQNRKKKYPKDIAVNMTAVTERRKE